MRCYFEAQLFAKATDVHRNQARNDGTSPLPEISPYKVKEDEKRKYTLLR